MATEYDLNITKGSSFSVEVTAQDEDGNTLNLSGYSLRGYAKFRYSDTGNFLNLNPTGFLGDSHVSGKLGINLDATGTTGLNVTQGRYDVELYSGNYVKKLLKGFANVLPEITTAD